MRKRNAQRFLPGFESPAALLSPASARISALAPRSIPSSLACATKPFAPSHRMNSPAFLRTALVLVIGATAFNLGRYSVEFSGSAAAWVALICNLIALPVAIAALATNANKP